MLDLNPINERLNKATQPKPSHVDFGTHLHVDCYRCEMLEDYIEEWHHDRKNFFGYAPTDMRAMIDEIERLRAENDRLKRKNAPVVPGAGIPICDKCREQQHAMEVNFRCVCGCHT